MGVVIFYRCFFSLSFPPTSITILFLAFFVRFLLLNSWLLLQIIIYGTNEKKIKIKFDFLQPFLLYILLIITQKEKNVYIFCHTLDEVKCLSFFRSKQPISQLGRENLIRSIKSQA